jgi:PAS domain S-box-containing protein
VGFVTFALFSRASAAMLALRHAPVPWHKKRTMTLPQRLAAVPQRPGSVPVRAEVAPALYRLLAEASLSRAALDACGLPVALLDAAASGQPVSYVNQAFENFFGYRAAEALGRPLGVLLAAEGGAAERLLRDAGGRMPLRARRKDGSQVHVEAAVGSVRGSDGRVTHWVLAFSDRSELELLREELGALRAAVRGA